MRPRTTFLFDLDGTLTRTELLPLIARRVGLEDEIGELTRLTIAGLIDFESSFRLRIRLLSSIPVADVAEIVAEVPVQEELMRWIGDNRDRCRVVTGNLDCWVSEWLKRWGLQGYTSRAEFVDGSVRLRPNGILRKEDVVHEFGANRVVAIGDGANDAGMVGAAHFGIANETIHPVPPVLFDAADCLVSTEEALCRILERL